MQPTQPPMVLGWAHHTANRTIDGFCRANTTNSNTDGFGLGRHNQPNHRWFWIGPTQSAQPPAVLDCANITNPTTDGFG